jgi:hypothetical protein
MAVFRELTIKWKGTDYTFVPSMKLMRSIEDEVSIARLTARAGEGDIPISHANFVLTKILRACGAKFSEEEVWSELNAMGTEKMSDMIAIALSSFVPSMPNVKNQDAQTESQSKARAEENETN